MASPSIFSSPPSSQVARSHIDWTWPRLWVTSTIVTPFLRSLYTWSKQRRLKRSSPTAITSSSRRISGSTWTATEKPSRTFMPLE